MNIEEIIKYFEERESLNSIGHAYLFSNADYENIKDTLKNIICSVILKNNAELEDNPDIYFIEPDNNVIKKEKILELEEKLSKTSQIGESKLYIIKECEKLNSSAANCLLKTLEEPGKNIYSFLLTSNIDNVISTIKSRCQIIQCAVEDNKISSKEIIEKSICIIKVIEEIGVKSIAYKSNELYKAFEKDELKQILKTIELFYKDCLNKMYGLPIKLFNDYENYIDIILKNNNYKKLIKKIKILNDNIDLLKYNLNGNLFIDKFLIEFGRL